MDNHVFIGIDIGGTKIASALVTNHGHIISRTKNTTPEKASSRQLLSAVTTSIRTLLSENNMKIDAISGIGFGIPGILNSERKTVLTSPNLSIDGCNIVEQLQKRFNIPIAGDNDVNVGLLGEQWLGAAQQTKNCIGLFPGTGLGGAILINGELFTGAHGAGAELGHVIIDKNGPVCPCHNKGCAEALSGRRAIERDIKNMLKKYHDPFLSRLIKKNNGNIKSGLLRKALKQNDPIVQKVIKKAAEDLGRLAVSLRHIFDPELFILGGGLIEACGFFITSHVQKAVLNDPFFKAIPACHVLEARLGDDAIILGAVALIQQRLNLALHYSPHRRLIQVQSSKKISIGSKEYSADTCIRSDGKVRSQKKKKKKKKHPAKYRGLVRVLTDYDIKQACKKEVKFLFIAAWNKSKVSLSLKAKAYLQQRAIDWMIFPFEKAVDTYISMPYPKAIIFIFPSAPIKK